MGSNRGAKPSFFLTSLCMVNEWFAAARLADVSRRCAGNSDFSIFFNLLREISMHGGALGISLTAIFQRHIKFYSNFHQIIGVSQSWPLRISVIFAATCINA